VSSGTSRTLFGPLNSCPSVIVVWDVCKHAVRSTQKHRELLKRCLFNTDLEAAVSNLALDPQDDCHVLILLCYCRVVWHLGASTSTQSCESNPRTHPIVQGVSLKFREYLALYRKLLRLLGRKCLLMRDRVCQLILYRQLTQFSGYEAPPLSLYST
jgi:hypothetical protein